MKNITLFLLVPLFLVAVNSSNVSADSIGANDWVQIGWGTHAGGNGGGEFKLTKLDPDTLNPLTPAIEILSFCVEKDQHISIGGKYKVASPLDDVIDSTSTRVSNLTKFLITAWFTDAFGGLDTYGLRNGISFGARNSANAAILQEAIWYFEDGRDAYSSNQIVQNALSLATAASFFEDPQTRATIKRESTFLENVKVFNLVNSNDGQKQSQLSIAIPEPSAMILLGTAFIGLGVISRRRFR